MRALFLTLRLAGENLKLLMVIADDARDEAPALGATPGLGPLSLPPPHPVTSTAATAAVERRLYVR